MVQAILQELTTSSRKDFATPSFEQAGATALLIHKEEEVDSSKPTKLFEGALISPP